MVRFLGIIFIALIPTGIIGFADYHYGGNFLYNFAQNQSMGIMGTILALNIATVTFLLGNLYTIEDKAGKEVFASTKKEVKQNVYFMAGIFLTNLFMLALMPELNSQASGIQPAFVLSLVSLMLIILIIFALIEIVQAIFSVSKFISKN